MHACGRGPHYGVWGEPLSLFKLIRGDSCGHHTPASAPGPPRLPKPAIIIILQQPPSNWATSPSAVSQQHLHQRTGAMQPWIHARTWERHIPADTQTAGPSHLNCISWAEDLPAGDCGCVSGTAFRLSAVVPPVCYCLAPPISGDVQADNDVPDRSRPLCLPMPRARVIRAGTAVPAETHRIPYSLSFGYLVSEKLLLSPVS